MRSIGLGGPSSVRSIGSPPSVIRGFERNDIGLYLSNLVGLLFLKISQSRMSSSYSSYIHSSSSQVWTDWCIKEMVSSFASIGRGKVSLSKSMVFRSEIRGLL